MLFKGANKSHSLQKIVKGDQNANNMMTKNLREANSKLGKLINNYDNKLQPK